MYMYMYMSVYYMYVYQRARFVDALCRLYFVCMSPLLVCVHILTLVHAREERCTYMGEHLLDEGSRVLVARAALTLHEEFDQHLVGNSVTLP